LVRFKEAYFYHCVFLGLLRKCTRFEILEAVNIDIAGFQDMKLCNKLTCRPHFLPQFTALVKKDCNLNKKYLIKTIFCNTCSFSLGFLQAGQFDSSCLYNPDSDREVDVKNLGRLLNTLPNYCAGFLSSRWWGVGGKFWKSTLKWKHQNRVLPNS